MRRRPARAASCDRRTPRPAGCRSPPALYSRLTPRENLRLFASLERLPDPEAASERLLAEVQLLGAADRPAGDLSVGNAQRLNVAIGLLGEPRLVLLDEPTASLDPRQRRVLWGILGGVVARGGAVVFATHDLEEARLHADRLAVLHDGELAFDGGHDELLAQVGEEPGESGFERALVRLLGGEAAGRPEAVA